jgi:hypothetical protein
MGIYKIDGYDRAIAVHERSEVTVTLTPGRAGEVFEALGEPGEAELRLLGYDRATQEHRYAVHGHDRIPAGMPAVVRMIVFGGDSSGEFGAAHEAHEILETDHNLDPALDRQV